MLYYTKLTYGGWGLVFIEEENLSKPNILINAYGIEDVEVEEIVLDATDFKENFEIAPMNVILFYRNLIKSNYYKELTI